MDMLLNVIVFCMSIVTIAILARILRGYLGMRISLVRLLLAALVTFFVYEPLQNGLLDQRSVDALTSSPDKSAALWFALLAMVISLIVGVSALLVSELLIPSGSLPGPVFAWHAFRRFIGRARRYREIGLILLRRGLLAYLFGGRRREASSIDGRTDLARHVRLAMNDAGVTFVKFGQILSTRPDLVPPEFLAELQHLQNRADALPWSVMEPVLASALGDRNLDEVFAAFDKEPLAAASIAQVHAATLISGEDVVVKLRRPGIEVQVEQDLDILTRLAAMLEGNTTWGRSMGFSSLAEGFAAALREELDLRIEADNMRAVTATTASAPTRHTEIPKTFPDLSNAHVLVMERIKGVPLSDAHEVIRERGLNADEIANGLFGSLLYQILVGGVFHADPHPGNVMLLPDDRLMLLDFGSVGRIDGMLREAVIRLLLAIDAGDALTATDALIDLVDRPDGLDEHRLERAMGQFLALHAIPGMQPGTRMFTDLFALFAKFRLSVPREVAAMFRAIGTLEGTVREVAPQFNILDASRAFSRDILKLQASPEVLKRTMMEELVALVPTLRRLPRRLDRITSALEDGRLRVNVAGAARPADQRAISDVISNVLTTVLAGASGVMSVVLMSSTNGPHMTPTVTVFQFVGYALLAASMILALRVLVGVFRIGSRRL